MPIFNCRAENITFANRCLSSDLDMQLRHLFASLIQPRMQAADFDGQKKDLISKLRLSESNGEERIRRAVLSSLIADNCPYYPQHPEQEINALSTVKLSDVQDFYRTHVNAGATAIIIAGDIQPKQVFALLDDITRNWTASTGTTSTNPNIASSSSSDNAQANVEKEKVSPIPRLFISNRQVFKSSILLPQESQSQVILGRIIPFADVKQMQAAWVALHVADCVLSSNPIFSRLAEKFEAKPELLAETDDKLWNTKIIKLANKLVWFMNIRLKPGTSSAAAITAIQQELEEFGQTGLTSQDLNEARRYLAGSLALQECFNLDKLTRFVFRGYNELNEIDLLTKTKKIMTALRSDDMNQFISNLFKPQSATLVVAGPRQLIKQVHPISQATEPD
jgi:predicted Zn-dependent peptidase